MVKNLPANIGDIISLSIAAVFSRSVLDIIYSSLVAVLSRSVLSDSVTPWTVAHQAPLFMGILQAGILEWVAMPFSRGSSQPRDRTWVSHIAGGFFTG